MSEMVEKVRRTYEQAKARSGTAAPAGDSTPQHMDKDAFLEQAKAEWAATPGLQEEFPSASCFAHYKWAESNGKVRIHGSRTLRR